MRQISTLYTFEQTRSNLTEKILTISICIFSPIFRGIVRAGRRREMCGDPFNLMKSNKSGLKEGFVERNQ